MSKIPPALHKFPNREIASHSSQSTHKLPVDTQTVSTGFICQNNIGIRDASRTEDNPRFEDEEYWSRVKDRATD